MRKNGGDCFGDCFECFTCTCSVRLLREDSALPVALRLGLLSSVPLQLLLEVACVSLIWKPLSVSSNSLLAEGLMCLGSTASWCLCRLARLSGALGNYVVGGGCWVFDAMFSRLSSAFFAGIGHPANWTKSKRPLLFQHFYFRLQQLQIM